MIQGLRAAAAALLLAGCAAQAPAPAGRLVPADTGLNVEGTGLEIGFGRTMPGAVAAASRLIGRDPGRRTEAGGGCEVVAWRDGFEMHALGGAFVGWRDPAAPDGRTEGGRLCPA